MRKVKLQMQMSLDGFVAGPKGELDWMIWNWDDELKDYVTRLTEPVDCILLGRKVAHEFIPYWEAVAANPEDPEYAFGRKMNDTPRIVFSKTLERSEWKNANLASDPAQEVARLKKEPGKDIVIYGGAKTVSSFIAQGLIDEYNLFINPVAIGNGLSIFKGLEKLELKLISARPFNCGVVAFCYQPAKRST